MTTPTTTMRTTASSRSRDRHQWGPPYNPLTEMMDALVEATGKSRSFWTMQQEDRDPFHMDKEGNHRDAAWLRNRWDGLDIPVGLHARGSCRNRAASCWPGVRGFGVAPVREQTSGPVARRNRGGTCLAHLAEKTGVVKSVSQVLGSAAESPGNNGCFPAAPQPFALGD